MPHKGVSLSCGSFIGVPDRNSSLIKPILSINSQERAEHQEKKATVEHQGSNIETKELPDD
jgi:hypothetical protein